MRTVALEEHAAVPELWDAVGFTLPPPLRARLEDMGEGRIAELDANGIDFQIMSMQPADCDDQALSRRATLAFNEAAAAAIAAHPTRLAAFATLPYHDPKEAAAELERAVTQLGLRGALVGTRTGAGFLSEEANWPIFEAAEALGVPIYVHPSMPPKVIFEGYYADLGDPLGRALSMGLWGWHLDTGMHTVRLIARGVFDRFPKLQAIVGHMGEGIPFMMARIEEGFAGLARFVPGFDVPFERPFRNYFHSNIHLTTSGFFDNVSLQCAITAVGVDRIMFSVDYPYSSNGEGRAFIDAAPLENGDREAIAHGNADRLFGLS